MTTRLLAGLRPSVPFSLYAQQVGKRKGQELLAGVGIAVGVALVFGVLLASTSVTRSASETVRGVSGGATLQLAARSPTGFDARLVPAVEQLAGVQRSGAVLRENTTIVGPTGRTPAQLVGFTVGVIGLGGSSTRALAQGAVSEAGGLVLSSSLARRIGARSGQSVTVLAAGAAHKIRVVELLSESRFGALAASLVAVAQMSVAQTLTGRGGRVTQILVKPSPGANAAVSRELERLAGRRLEVLPANNEIALLDEAFRPSEQSTDLFALISAMVGFLLAFNAVLLTVPERRRSAAELMILGYDATQVAVIVIVQALILGVLSSFVGLAVGYLLAHTLFGQAPTYLAFAFPIGEHKSASLLILVLSFACGLGAAVLATLPVLELWRKRAPEEILRERGEHGQSIRPRVVLVLAIVGGVLSGIVALLALASASTTVACGVLLAIAAGCVTPMIYRLAMRSLSPIGERRKGMLGLSLIELETTATRSIALAAVGALIVYGSVAIGGARVDVTRGLEHTITQYESTADVWVSTGNNVFDTDAFRAPGLVPALTQLPGVASVRAYQGGLLDVGKRRLLIRAHDPHVGVMLQSLAIVRGNLAQANKRLREGGWATVSEGFAGEHHLAIGDTLVLPTPSGHLRLRVAATTTNLGWPPGLITLSSTDYRRGWLTSDPSALEVTLKPGVAASKGSRAVQHALGRFPGLQARTAAQASAEGISTARQGLNSLAQISTLLLIVGAAAIAASLSAAIWQGRLRLASMRVEGYDRVQLWCSVLWESAILLTIGGAVGAAFGLYGHALASRYLRVTTGFPAPFTVGGRQLLLTLLLLGGTSLAVVALPGIRAVQVPLTTAFED
ncbi:MAG: ABC transporter permease [Solirubrobacteraceae bacterium]